MSARNNQLLLASRQAIKAWPLKKHPNGSQVKVSDDMFVIPENGDFILYLPLLGNVLKVNSAVVTQLQKFGRGSAMTPRLKDELLRVGVLATPQAKRSGRKPTAKDFLPTSVSLFTTSDCNLRCVYCYARAGIQQDVLDWKIAKAAIDFIVANARKTKKQQVSVSFHGGGETTFGKSWPIVTRSVDYAHNLAKQHGLQLHSSLVTNGVMNDEKRRWIAANLQSIGISFDGPADIQNRQRPSASGGETFPSVMRSIRFFEAKRFPYDIRVTITRQGVQRMAEIVRFITANTSRKSVAIEPVAVCGRCSENTVTDVDADMFLSNFLACRTEFPDLKIRYSGSNPNQARHTFCGACGKNFSVLPGLSGGFSLSGERESWAL